MPDFDPEQELTESSIAVQEAQQAAQDAINRGVFGSPDAVSKEFGISIFLAISFDYSLKRHANLFLRNDVEAIKNELQNIAEAVTVKPKTHLTR